MRAPYDIKAALASPGRALDPSTRSFMESRLNHDFSHVRIHTDDRAARSTASVGAPAYTVGHHIAFDRDQYAPDTSAGRELLAHELTHVRQQGADTAAGGPITMGRDNDPAEAEAAQAAQAVAGGGVGPAASRRMPVSVQRAPPRAGEDRLHQPMLDQFRREHGLPPGGLDPSGQRVGPSDAEIKYGTPADASVLAHELQLVIDGATWKEIRKRVYPKESAPGIQRAKERKAGRQPDLTGLGQIRTLDHFTTAIKSLQSRWGRISPPLERAKAVGRAVSAELVSVDVPAFRKVETFVTEFKGAFDGSEWRFLVSDALVREPALTDKDAAEVANTGMHEGRHAEQAFLAARFDAGVNGKDAAAIETQHLIPRAIATEAVAKKFNAATDATTKDLGKRMFQASVTDRAANHRISNDDGLSELQTKREAAAVALRNLLAVPVTRNIADATVKRDDLKAQIKVVEDRYTLYRAIPYEADAHEVGDAAELAFKGWPP
jgi:alpha-D-ribose 1-methylphosphonate 5-triphosphate synthase subunit PhnG